MFRDRLFAWSPSLFVSFFNDLERVEGNVVDYFLIQRFLENLAVNVVGLKQKMIFLNFFKLVLIGIFYNRNNFEVFSTFN